MEARSIRYGEYLILDTYEANGAKAVRADLIYTLNGGMPYKEWFRMQMKLVSSSKGVAELQGGTTHCHINLIDENNFLVSYPEVANRKPYSATALPLKDTKQQRTGR